MMNKPQSPKEVHVSGRISREIEEIFKRTGKAFCLGNKCGISSLVSLSCVTFGTFLIEIDRELHLHGKKIEDLVQASKSWRTKYATHPLIQLTERKDITSLSTEDVMVMIFNLSNERGKLTNE
jgi:hypothetical protein